MEGECTVDWEIGSDGHYGTKFKVMYCVDGALASRHVTFGHAPGSVAGGVCAYMVDKTAIATLTGDVILCNALTIIANSVYGLM